MAAEASGGGAVALSALIEVRLADVGVRSDAEAALRELHTQWAPCGGIFHLAGALDDGLARDLEWDRCERVLSAKVYGALHLHSATCALQLLPAHFVLFSSVYALLG